jgi:hypothetical protein
MALGMLKLADTHDGGPRRVRVAAPDANFHCPDCVATVPVDTAAFGRQRTPHDVDTVGIVQVFRRRQ